jgi:hypothetical protein
VAYLLLLNGLLNSGLIPRLLSQQPQRLTVRWGSAWALWTGAVHVRDFTLRNQDPKAQFELTIGEAETAVEVTALLERRFQTRWVRAADVDFRFRPRLARDEHAVELGEHFPPIEGFADALVAEHPELEAGPYAGEPWAVQLEDVTVERVREVWVGAYRGALDADVKGRFWLKLDHSLSIGPSTASIHRAAVFQGPVPVASAVSGSVVCTAAIKDSLVDEGAAVWQSVNGRVDLDGQLDSLAFLTQGVERATGLQVSGGKAVIKLEASVLRGKLLAGSRLEVAGDEAAALVGPYRLRGAFSAQGLVATAEGKLLSTLAVSLRPMVLESLAGDRLVQSTGVTATLAARDVVLGKVPDDATVSVGLAPTAPFPLRLLNPFVASDLFSVDSGAATVRAKLETGPGGKRGSLTLKTNRAQVRVGRSRVSGAAVVDLDLARLRFEQGSVLLSGSSAEFSNVSILSSRARPRGWSGKLTLDAAQLTVRPGMSGSAEVSGVFSDALPFLALFGDLAGLPRWATPLFEASGLRVSGSLSFVGSTLRLRNLQAAGEGLQIHGQLDVAAAEVSGVFLVKVQGFTLGLKVTPQAVVPQLLDPDAWYALQVASR